MRKLFLLPLLATAALVSQAYAQCKTADGATTIYCKWSGSCNPINLTYAENPSTATCKGEAVNCQNYSGPKGSDPTGGPSTLYSDGTCSTTFACNDACLNGLKQGVVDTLCTGYYCKWSDTSCDKIYTDIDGINGTIQLTCAAAISHCASSSHNPVYSNSTCTTPIPSSSSATPSSSSTTPSSSSVAPSSSSGGSSSSNGSSSSVAPSSSSGGSSSSNGSSSSVAPSSSSGGSSSSNGSSSSVSSSSGGSSSSSEDSTPITNRTTLVAGQTQKYYSLKGEPLGNAKPQKAGIYIVKEGSSIKKIAVR